MIHASASCLISNRSCWCQKRNTQDHFVRVFGKINCGICRPTFWLACCRFMRSLRRSFDHDSIPKLIFQDLGVPVCQRVDGGPQFSSRKFAAFRNGDRVMPWQPRWPRWCHCEESLRPHSRDSPHKDNWLWGTGIHWHCIIPQISLGFLLHRSRVACPLVPMRLLSLVPLWSSGIPWLKTATMVSQQSPRTQSPAIPTVPIPFHVWDKGTYANPGSLTQVSRLNWCCHEYWQVSRLPHQADVWLYTVAQSTVHEPLTVLSRLRWEPSDDTLRSYAPSVSVQSRGSERFEWKSFKLRLMNVKGEGCVPMW